MTPREFYAITRESDYALRLELLQSQLGGGAPQLSMNAATRPRVRGVQTAVTSMVSP